MQGMYDSFKFWVDVIQMAVLAGLGIAGWQMRRDKSQDARIVTLEKLFADKVGEHEVRLTRIEEGLKHVPSSAEVAALTERIDALGDGVQRLNRGLDLINDFLLKNK